MGYKEQAREKREVAQARITMTQREQELRRLRVQQGQLEANCLLEAQRHNGTQDNEAIASMIDRSPIRDLGSFLTDVKTVTGFSPRILIYSRMATISDNTGYGEGVKIYEDVIDALKRSGIDQGWNAGAGSVGDSRFDHSYNSVGFKVLDPDKQFGGTELKPLVIYTTTRGSFWRSSKKELRAAEEPREPGIGVAFRRVAYLGSGYTRGEPSNNSFHISGGSEYIRFAVEAVHLRLITSDMTAVITGVGTRIPLRNLDLIETTLEAAFKKPHYRTTDIGLNQY